MFIQVTTERWDFVTINANKVLYMKDVSNHHNVKTKIVFETSEVLLVQENITKIINLISEAKNSK